MKYTHRQCYTSRETTPRQRRLAAEKQAKQAQVEMIFHAIAGGVLLVLLFLALNLI
jgi:uncharacterized integral membrane protein